MMHFGKVLSALRGNLKRHLRIWLRLKPRPKAPVLQQSLENILERHIRLCRLVMDLKPPGDVLKDGAVCEVGPGDCLATAALFLGLGARRVDLVEIQPAVVNEKQIQVLETIRDTGLPIDMDVVTRKPRLDLNPDRIRYHMGFMENVQLPVHYDFIFSTFVLEHVEDLQAFFTACAQSLKPGGSMVHIIDLGGHNEFEDPVPPLDFQTYPDWLYSLMYPRFHRATRRFVSDYEQAVQSCGLHVVERRVLRHAHADYLKSIRDRLRPAARSLPTEELATIEFALVLQQLGDK